MSNRSHPKARPSGGVVSPTNKFKTRHIAKLLMTMPLLYGAAPQLAVADDVLETIVVTAQKRTQSLQDVPLSVTAVSAKALADYGMQNFDDIAIPGVHIGTGARNDSLFVRGIGSGTNFGFEQSVPIYIDGAYYGRARSQNMGFMDVDRIEVLKGPQPTYFGQNAIAGAVSITTARPTKEFTGYVDASYETKAREKVVSAAISGPFSDALRARAAVKLRDQDGWMTNVVLNTRVPQRQDQSLRLSAELDVTANFKAYAKLETSDEKQYGRNRQIFKCGVVNSVAATVARYIDRSANSPEDCQFNDTEASTLSQAAHQFFPLEGNWGYVSKLKYDGGLVALDWNLNGYKLSSITSYYKLDFRIPQSDNDGTSNEVGGTAAGDTNKQYSQELRVLSPEGQSFEWIAGVYVDHGDLNTSTTGGNQPAGPGTGGPALFQTAAQTSSSWSVFAEGAFKLTDSLTGKLGGRYSEVKKSTVVALIGKSVNAAGTLLNAPFPGFPSFNFVDSRKDTSIQPAATLEYRPEKNVMTYTSVKKGFKAGGYDQDGLTIPAATNTLAFSPEKVNSYEAGIKSKLLGGKATLNAAVFRSDYQDLQVSVFTGSIGFKTSNAAKARTQGLEVDGAYAVTNQLTLKAAMTHLDGKYQSFPGASCNAIQALATPAGVTCVQDMGGKRLQFSPDWSGNLGAALKFPLGSNLKGTAQVDVFFTSKFNTANAQDPNTVQEGYSKIDARFGVSSHSGNWELALVGRNLTNKYTSHWIETGVFGARATGIAYATFLDRPRQIEVQGKLSF